MDNNEALLQNACKSLFMVVIGSQPSLALGPATTNPFGLEKFHEFDLLIARIVILNC